MEHEARPDQITTRKVAILVAEGFDYEQVVEVREALESKGAWPQAIAKRHGKLKETGDRKIEVDAMLLTTDSVLWDAVFIPGGGRPRSVGPGGGDPHGRER